jgi:hypothetical protein
MPMDYSNQPSQSSAWLGPLNQTGGNLTAGEAANSESSLAGARTPGANHGPSPATPFGLPDWSYKPDHVTKADPINVIFYGSDWTVVRDALINQGWWVIANPNCQNDEHVYYAGTWRSYNVGLAATETSPCAGLAGSIRQHMRLWQLETNLVVGDAHLDYMPPPPSTEHVAVWYEEIEQKVANYMRFTDASPWQVREDLDEYFLANMVDEYRQGFHTFNNGYPTVIWKQSGASANIHDNLATSLLTIPGWGGIIDFDNDQVQVYSISGTVRWSLAYGKTSYSSGTVPSGGVATVSYPHWTAWIMSIWRQEISSSNMGAIMCKENDGYLGCITLLGGKVANVGDDLPQGWLSIPSFGVVSDTGSSSDNRRLRVTSYGSVVEWALWHQGSYAQGEAAPYTTSYVPFPDAKFFMVLVWRMNVEDSYWAGDYVGVLLCREDNNYLGCMIHNSGLKAYTLDSTVSTLSQVSAIGGVRDTGDPAKANVVRLYSSSGSSIEGAYWTNNTYTPKDIGSGQTWDFAFDHYKFFVFVAARHYRVMWLFCRENDSTVGCAPLRWF